MKKLLMCLASASFSVSALLGDVATLNIINDSSTLLKNSAGGALTQGGPANGDGALVQLGYYSSATSGNKFLGTWVPLTAALHVGDSSTNTGAGDGRIGFNLYFKTGTNVVDVYDTTFDAGHYTTISSITITTGVPGANQLLALRFFDTVNGATGFFNAVSSDSWLWQSPTAVGPNYTFSLGASQLQFQDAANPFKTTIPVPEPGSLLYLGLIGGAMVGGRRRRLWLSRSGSEDRL